MDKKMSQALFAHLMMSLAQSALMGMGKIIHPAVGKAEVDLQGAQQAIDLLEMLQDRTKGNLDSDEDRALTQTLSMLQMNYVETAAATPASPEPATAPAAPPAPEVIAGGEAKPSDDDEKVRFRKSYG